MVNWILNRVCYYRFLLKMFLDLCFLKLFNATAIKVLAKVIFKPCLKQLNETKLNVEPYKRPKDEISKFKISKKP